MAKTDVNQGFILSGFLPAACGMVNLWVEFDMFFSWDVCVIENFPTSGTTSTWRQSPTQGPFQPQVPPLPQIFKKITIFRKIIVTSFLAAWSSRGWSLLDIYQTFRVQFYFSAWQTSKLEAEMIFSFD